MIMYLCISLIKYLICLEKDATHLNEASNGISQYGTKIFMKRYLPECMISYTCMYAPKF